MKRFLMFVGVAVVAAAMYVAAAPGSRQAKGPTAKQFNALKRQVASLSAKLAATTKKADDADGFVNDCLITNGGAWAVSEFGDGTAGTFGYWYTDNGTNYSNVTALDFDSSNTPDAWLQAVNPTCVTPNSAPHAATQSERARLAPHAQRSH